MMTIELTDLEARALRSVIFAIQATNVGEQLRRRLYDWQTESLVSVASKLTNND